MLLACSGPHALESIQSNIAASRVLFAAATAVLAVPLVRFAKDHRRPRGLVPLVVLVVLHPGWWFPADGGDCGILKFGSSVGVTLACGILAALSWLRPRGGERR